MSRKDSDTSGDLRVLLTDAIRLQQNIGAKVQEFLGDLGMKLAQDQRAMLTEALEKQHSFVKVLRDAQKIRWVPLEPAALSGVFAAQAELEKTLNELTKAAASEGVQEVGKLVATFIQTQEALGKCIEEVLQSKNILLGTHTSSLADSLAGTGHREYLSSDLFSAMLGFQPLVIEDLLPNPSADLRRPRRPSPQLAELAAEMAKLKAEVDEFAAKIRAERVEGKKQAEARRELEAKLGELQELSRLGFLLQNVRPEAHAAIRGSKELQAKFLGGTETPTFVMSIDIRRSTELMLKAKSAENFVGFISALCGELVAIVKESNGVVDKFTGDGILCFFPDFYSGSDAGYLTVSSAQRCHRAFEEVYKLHRSSFTSVLTRVGLGIGVDFGRAHLVQLAGGLTVVGTPVVYACRLGGAPAGRTLLNQPAFEALSNSHPERYAFTEVEHEIKHEGHILAYEVRLVSQDDEPESPGWLADARGSKS